MGAVPRELHIPELRNMPSFIWGSFVKEYTVIYLKLYLVSFIKERTLFLLGSFIRFQVCSLVKGYWVLWVSYSGNASGGSNGFMDSGLGYPLHWIIPLSFVCERRMKFRVSRASSLRISSFREARGLGFGA